MPRITPNLWFDTQSVEAAEFYVSIFPNSKITNITHYGDAGPRPAGTVLTVDFVLDGQERVPRHQRSVRSSRSRGDLTVDQLRRPARDRLLLGQAHRDGGEEGPCGWLKDKFGLSWQVCPVGWQDC